jgi:hypothetical protein
MTYASDELPWGKIKAPNTTVDLEVLQLLLTQGR